MSEQMLRPEIEQTDEFEPYWYPLLRRDAKLYRRFLQMLHKAAGYLVVFTQRPKARCGAFLVKKRDGEKIRLIIDARGMNAKFKAPQMGSPALR